MHSNQSDHWRHSPCYRTAPGLAPPECGRVGPRMCEGLAKSLRSLCICLCTFHLGLGIKLFVKGPTRVRDLHV